MSRKNRVVSMPEIEISVLVANFPFLFNVLISSSNTSFCEIDVKNDVK